MLHFTYGCVSKKKSSMSAIFSSSFDGYWMRIKLSSSNEFAIWPINYDLNIVLKIAARAILADWISYSTLTHTYCCQSYHSNIHTSSFEKNFAHFFIHFNEPDNDRRENICSAGLGPLE